MTTPEILQPDDISVECLQSLYDEAGLQTNIDSDGDLSVTVGVTCYAIPAEHRDRILLLAFVGIREDVSHEQKVEFANRVNNQVSTVRARVTNKGSVMFDYHIPIEGGITGAAIVAATRFFLEAAVHAADQCDNDQIIR